MGHISLLAISLMTLSGGMAHAQTPSTRTVDAAQFLGLSLFKALDTIPDKPFAVRLLHDIANSPNRSHTQGHLALYDYIAALTLRGEIMTYINNASEPLITSKDGTLILPIYSDYLGLSPQITSALEYLASQNRKSAVHVLGHVSPEVKQMAQQRSVQAVSYTHLTLPTTPYV